MDSVCDMCYEYLENGDACLDCVVILDEFDIIATEENSLNVE